jgi:hypothetical protein
VIAKTFSATVLGIDAYLIEVEVDVSVGMSGPCPSSSGAALPEFFKQK